MRLPELVAYQAVVQHPRTAFADPQLRAASVTSGRLGLPRAVAGNFAVTYQLCNGSQQWAVRCFHREAADRASRYAAISKALAGLRNGPLVPIEYLQSGVRVGAAWYPITKMPWIDGHPLNRAVEARLSTPNALRELEQRFVEMVAELRRRGIAHGDLQHGNILVHPSGAIRLVDYDGMFVKELKGRSASESGDPNYQHPRRSSQFDAELDRFATLVIVLALRALAANPRLWNIYNTGDNLLFRRADFMDPGASALFRDLSTLPTVREFSKRFADICQADYARVPTLDDIMANSSTSRQPATPLLKPAHVVALNRLYGPRPRPTRSRSVPRSWKLRRTLVQHAVAFSADGALLATGDDEGKISIRDAATGRTRHDLRIKRVHGSIGDLAVTRAGGVLAVVTTASNLSVWDATAGREVQRFTGLRGVRTAALSAGGGWLAVGTTDGRLRCCSLSNGRLVAACSAPARILAIAISPDGRLMASAGARGGIDVWQVPGGRRHSHLAAGRGLACLAFTADGLGLVVGWSSGQVSVWDLADGGGPHPVPGTFPDPRSLALSPDGENLAGTGGDGSIWLRRLPPRTTTHAPSPRTGRLLGWSGYRVLEWLRRVALL